MYRLIALNQYMLTTGLTGESLHGLHESCHHAHGMGLVTDSKLPNLRWFST